MSKGHNLRPWHRAVIILTVMAAAAAVLVILIYLRRNLVLEIKIKGDPEVTVEYGEEWHDPGATAMIREKKLVKYDEKVPVTAEGVVDTHRLGKYKIRYSAKKGRFSGYKDRTVTVRDTRPPVIKLEGDADVKLPFGTAFSDAFSAEDNADGDLTGNVEVSGKVDPYTPGQYTITYTVRDSSGNEADAVRTVIVEERKPDPAEGLNKVIYLTFDDGPGPETDRLLDILDKYGIKATFFVTGARPDYADCIGRAASRGHSIGVHTMTHDYSKVYANTDAFWADFEQAEQLVESQTGHRTVLMRFPGGSSNTVSCSTCPGIMTELTRQAGEKGYSYFDWNVSSGDGSGNIGADKVFNNVTNGVKGHDVSVVLCHASHSDTVDAMDKTIDWLIKSGYTFLPLTEGCYMAHHPVSN